MKTYIPFTITTLILLLACQKNDDTVTPPGPTTPSTPGVVTIAGVAAWDALSESEKARVTSWNTLFLHQSVGTDLEDGSEANGYKFAYYGPDQQLSTGLSGGIFVDVSPGLSNGNPLEKLQVFKNNVLKHKASLRIASMKFGYADIREEDLTEVENEYVKVVDQIKAAGIRVVHITPPLVYAISENSAKMKMRTWMLQTFKQDIVFDFQDIESQTDGSRCQQNDIWRICQANRSTTSCPSKGQGVDGDGAGHLCEAAATQISKGLLYAIYQAGK
ncbi:hypothetical protein [Xanthocytophaga flava]|uniref:hypothetical protein n=1 Tax=Xanthocytophaga flava TaxID=3048013 RepID=UPI0028D1A347|nr:hypothetical protein [Xanthocytophaga flavus]MDJ1470791.1 hypothetical protein [Xanthocytophaga flavus]